MDPLGFSHTANCVMEASGWWLLHPASKMSHPWLWMNLKPLHVFVLLKCSIKLLVRYRDMYIKKGTWTKDTAVLARLSEVCSPPSRIDSPREWVIWWAICDTCCVSLLTKQKLVFLAVWCWLKWQLKLWFKVLLNSGVYVVSGVDDLEMFIFGLVVRTHLEALKPVVETDEQHKQPCH